MVDNYTERGEQMNELMTRYEGTPAEKVFK